MAVKSRTPSHHHKTLLGSAVVALLLLAFTISNCSGGGGGSHNLQSPEEPPQKIPFQQLYDQGIDRYLGIYSPMLATENNGATTYEFGVGDGPLCMDGNPYRVVTVERDAQDLLIFLEGGGLCWSETCHSTTTAMHGLFPVGILDPDNPDNPLGAFNLVFMHYCDGGAFVSDRDSDTDGDGRGDRFQRGLHNLSAGLDIARGAFPAPGRIVLMGQSAGALATSFSLPLVRRVYPDIPIYVVNDSAVGIGRPGDPSLIQAWVDDWNIGAFFPPDCPDCLMGDGHLTRYNSWQLDEDQAAYRAMISHLRDHVWADSLLKIGIDAFTSQLLAEMQKLERDHPRRNRYWIPDSEGHAFLTRDAYAVAGDVSLLEWLDCMLNDSDDWVSITDCPSGQCP